MPGRQYTSATGYRYGFNGKENDNEVKGIQGSQQDYGFRIYDPRLGKFLSVDPLSKDYPELTPYQFASNTPIYAIDLDGLEACGNPISHSRGYTSHDCKISLHKDVTLKEQVTQIGGMALGFGVILTAPAWAPAGAMYGTKALIWGSNPVNQQTVAGLGGLAASIIDPNPNSDYPGGFDDLLKGGKLLLGKAFVLEKYAKKIEDSYNMFKEGFGLGIPKILSQSGQIMQAMYQTVKQGQKIAFDITGVDLTVAKKGFENFTKADEAGKITEWELSKILRDKELYENTIFHSEGKQKTAKELGLEFIEE